MAYYVATPAGITLKKAFFQTYVVVKYSIPKNLRGQLWPRHTK